MSQFGSSIPEDQFDTTQDQQFPDTYAMAPDQTASMEASSYSPINEPDQNSVAPTPTYEDIAALENVQVPDVASGNYIPGMRPQSQIDEMNQSRYAPAPQDRWMGDSFDQLNDPQGMYPWESAPEEPPVPTLEQQYGNAPSRNQMLARIRYSEQMQGVSQSTVLGIPIGLYRNDESAATVIERDNVARGLREGNDVLLRDYIAQGKTVVPRGVVSNLAKAVWQGYEQVSAGMNSVIVGVPAATIAAFTGSEVASDTAKLAFAYAKYLDNDVKYNGAKGGSDFEQYVLDVATGLPQIAFQTAAAFISAPLGLSNVAYALTGAGFAGGAQLNDSYQTYKDAGLSDTDAYKAALYDSMAAATSTAVTEYIAGKVIGFDKMPSARMALNMTAAKAFVKGAARGGLAEATQESLDQFGSDFIINLHRLDMEEFKDFYKQNPDWVKQTLKNAAYAGLVALPLGALPGAVAGLQNFQASARLTESVNLRVKTLPEDHPIRKMVEQDEMSVEDASTVIEWLANKEAKTRVQERADVQYRRMVGNALDFSEISDDQLKTIILMGADGTTARIAGTAEDAGAGANLNFAIHPEMAADELVRRGVIDGSLQASTPVTNAGQGTLTGLSSEEVDSFVADNPEIARELATQDAPISRKQMERLFGKPFAGNSEAARAAFKENLLSVMRDESGTVRRVEENRAKKAKQAGRNAIQSLTGLSGADLERVALGLAPENVMLLNEEKAKTRQEALTGGTLALKEIADRRQRSSMTEANVARGTAETRAGAMSPRALAAEREAERAEEERLKVTTARISLDDASQRFVDAFADFEDSITDTSPGGNTDLAMIAWQAYIVVNQIQTDSGLTMDRTFARFGGVDPSAVEVFNTTMADVLSDDNARSGVVDRAGVDATKIIEESRLRAALEMAIADANAISDPAHVISRPDAIKDLLGLSRVEGETDTEPDDETVKDIAVVIESGSALGVALRGVVDSNPGLADLVDAVDVETIMSLDAEGNHEARLLAKIDNIRRGLNATTAEGTPSKSQVLNAIREAALAEQAAEAKVMNDLVQQREGLEKQRAELESAARFYPDGRPRGVRAKKTDAEKKLEEDIRDLDLKIGGQRLVVEDVSRRLGQTSEGVHIPPTKVERTETFPSASAEARLQTILSARNQIAIENAVDAENVNMRWDDGETVLTTPERNLIEFGNKLGVTVVFVSSTKPIRTNGAQKDGVVFINSNLVSTPAAMWAIAVHETVHAIADIHPERFNNLLRLLRKRAPRALRIQSDRWFKLRKEQIKKKAPVAAANKLIKDLIAEESETAANQLKQFLWFVRNGTGEDLDILRANLPANLAKLLDDQGLFASTEEQSDEVVKRWKTTIRSVKAADKPSQQTLAEEEVAGVATMLMDAAFFSFVDENGKPDYDKLERLADGPRASKTLAGITSVIQDIMSVLRVPLALRGMSAAQVNAVRRLADGKLAELANPKRREMVASLFAQSLLQMMEIRKGKIGVEGVNAKPLNQTQINNEIPPLDDGTDDGGIGPKRPVRPRKPTGGKGKDAKGGVVKKPTSTKAPPKEPIDEEEEDKTDVADPDEADQEVVNDEPWMDDVEEQEPIARPEKPKKTKAKKEKPTVNFDTANGFKPTLVKNNKNGQTEPTLMSQKDVIDFYGFSKVELGFVAQREIKDGQIEGYEEYEVAAMLRYAQTPEAIARRKEAGFEPFVLPAGKVAKAKPAAKPVAEEKPTPKPSKKSGAPDLKPAAESAAKPVTKPTEKFNPVRQKRLTVDDFKEMVDANGVIALDDFFNKYALDKERIRFSNPVKDFEDTEGYEKLSKKDKALFDKGFLSVKAADNFNSFLDKTALWTNDGRLKYLTEDSGNRRGASLNVKLGAVGYAFEEAADFIGISLAEFNRIKKTIAFTNLKNASFATTKEIRAISIANYNDRIAGKKSKKAKGTDTEIDQSISGDETVDPKTKTPAFRKWFGKSMVSRNGNPIVVYHGTNETAFDAFSLDTVGKNVNRKIDGFYFSDEQENAKGYGKRIIPVYLSLQNPLVVDFDGLNFDGINIDEDTGEEEKIFSSIDELVAEAKRDGYDGLIAMNVADVGLDGDERIVGTTFVAFDPKQIKATTNNGAFSTETDNIDQSIDGGSEFITDSKLRNKLALDQLLESVVVIKPTDPRWPSAQPTGQFPTVTSQGKPKYEGEVRQPNLAAIVPAGRTVFHEANLSDIKQLVAKITQGYRNHMPFYVSDNIDLALGQKGKGYIVELDPAFVNGRPNTAKNLEFSESMGLGTEFVVDKTAKQSLLSITAPNERGVDALRFFKNLDKWFDFENPIQTERGIKLVRKAKPTTTPVRSLAEFFANLSNDPQVEAKLDASDPDRHITPSAIDQSLQGTWVDVGIQEVQGQIQIDPKDVIDIAKDKIDKSVIGKYYQVPKHMFSRGEAPVYLKIKNIANAAYLQNWIQQIAIKSRETYTGDTPEILVNLNTMLGYKKSKYAIVIDPVSKSSSWFRAFSFNAIGFSKTAFDNTGDGVVVAGLPTNVLEGNFNADEINLFAAVILHELAHAVTSDQTYRYLRLFSAISYGANNANPGEVYAQMQQFAADAPMGITDVNGVSKAGLAPKELISLARLYMAVFEALKSVEIIDDNFVNNLGSHPDVLREAFKKSATKAFTGNQITNPQITQQILDRIGYGLGNINEFIAMGAEDPFFRKFLQTLEVVRIDRSLTLSVFDPEVKVTVLDELTRLVSVIANDDQSWLGDREKPIRYRPTFFGILGDNALTRIKSTPEVIDQATTKTRFERLLADAAGGFASVADIESTLDQSLTADVIDKFDAVQNRLSRMFDGVKGIAKRVATKEGFPYVSLDAGDEDIEILSRNKDISPLWKYIAAPLNLAIASKIEAVLNIVEDLIDSDMRRNMVTASRTNEAEGIWASIPRSERNAEEFSKYMDEFYDPATIDSDPEFADKSQEFRDALKWFKTREEIRRTEIIDIRRQAMRKVLQADNSDEIVEKANNVGRVWSVELGPRSRKMIQTETGLITIDEARDELAKEMVPDTWGRQYAHMFHYFQGELKLAAYKADGTKEIIGSAFTEPEAFERLATHKKDNTGGEFVRWTAEPAIFINTDDAIALSAAQRNRLRKLLADATGAYSKDVSDAMRGIVTTHSNKRPFYGALIERTGAKGFETDFMKVWRLSERLHNRWKMGGEMIRTITPKIEELRKSYPAWAQYLTETMQHTLFTKPTATEQVIDSMVNKITLGFTAPFFTRRMLSTARAMNYGRQLFTFRQMAINSMQPLQTIYPIMGEANFAKAIAFYNTAEAKAILKRHGVFDAAGRFREGNETALGADVYDFVSKLQTNIESGTGVNVSAESRNQNFAFIAMYWHATRNLNMSEGEAARYARIYGNVYTQFHYTKANMPYMLRGPVASTAFQYRRFAINSLGLLANEIQKGNYSGAARYMGTLGIMGGFNGLIGTSAIGVIAALYRGDKEGADDMAFLLRKYLKDKLGSERAADVAVMGLPAMIGIDISGSISLLNKPFGRNIYEKIGATVAGPTVNTIIQMATNLSAETAVEMGVAERTGRALLDSSPSVQPFVSVMKMMNGDHVYQDAKGRKTFELDTYDQWMKLLAFRTTSESVWSMEYQRLRIIRTEVDNASDKAATQLASGNRAGAMKTLRDFNGMYPLAAITLADIKQRADNKKKSTTMSQLDRRVDLESSSKARKIAKSEGIGQ